MKRISLMLLAVCLLFFASAFNPKRVPAQAPLPAPVDLDIPTPPTAVRAGGKIHLFYELHITNFRPQSLELTGVEIYEEETRVKPLASHKDRELISRLARPGTPPDLPDGRVIGGGLRAIVFLQVTVDAEADLPRSLRHRLSLKLDDAGANGGERVVEGAAVSIQRSPPPLIAPPLSGDRWLAANSISNMSVHRRAIIPVDGSARIAQRFATDWIKLGPDGRPFHGDPAVNANWYGYGTELLAVANATVLEVKDGLPENVPLSAKRAVPITLETLGGNYVLLGLGRGYSVLYAHLRPNSLRVKVGEKVRRGQVLGLLGNSGNSDAPHLHMHIADANSPFGAEGVPYVFASFEVQGAVKSLGVLVGGEGWTPQPNAAVDKRRTEIPVENAIVRFQ